MDQAKKPAAMTEEARKERVREVLRAASDPLSPIEVAERIGEGWCMWNGSGFGSAVTRLLRKVGAKKSSGKWSLTAASAPEPGCIGDFGVTPLHVMSAAKWNAVKAHLEGQQ